MEISIFFILFSSCPHLWLLKHCQNILYNQHSLFLCHFILVALFALKSGGAVYSSEMAEHYTLHGTDPENEIIVWWRVAAKLENL